MFNSYQVKIVKALVLRTYEHLKLHKSTIKAAQLALLKILELDDSSIFEKARLAIQSGYSRDNNLSTSSSYDNNLVLLHPNNCLSNSNSTSNSNSVSSRKQGGSIRKENNNNNNNSNRSINDKEIVSRSDSYKTESDGNMSGSPHRAPRYMPLGAQSSVLDRRMSKGKNSIQKPRPFSIRNRTTSVVDTPNNVRTILLLLFPPFLGLLIFTLASFPPSFLDFFLYLLPSFLPSFPPSFLDFFLYLLPSFLASLLPFFLDFFLTFLGFFPSIFLSILPSVLTFFILYLASLTSFFPRLSFFLLSFVDFLSSFLPSFLR